MKNFFYECFGCLNLENKKPIETLPLSSFLASSLNVELVHIILKGMEKFTNNRKDNINESLSDK